MTKRIIIHRARNLVLFLLFVEFTAQAMAEPTKNSLSLCQENIKSSSKLIESEKLKLVLDLKWKASLAEHPESATYVGVPGYNHFWKNYSAPAREARKKLARCELKTLQALRRDKLKPEDQLTLDLALEGLKEQIENESFYSDHLIIDQMAGLQMDLPDLMFAAPKDRPADFEDRLKRLQLVPFLVNQQIELLREGLKLKVTPVKFLIEKVPQQINDVIPENIENSPLYKAFLEMPSSWPKETRESLLQQARIALQKDVYPALQKFQKFLLTKYIPECRTEISWSAMPKGNEWYAFLVRSSTTTDLKPADIHKLGLSEVERLQKEMEKIKDQVKYKGDVHDFHEFLKTSPQFFFEKSKDLLAAYREIAKRIDPELPRLFGRLPRLPYGIREIPSYKAAQAPTAYYVGGSALSGRAGYFEANTYDLNSRPKWEMEVLTLHEAVPGHHLQISLAQEIEDLPEFRKHESYTAFVEGWGLYAESLGADLGLYTDSYSKYGQLSYEMWRAVRLVVDTGIHSQSWSKDKALDYFMKHIPKTRLQAENEIDRYITWPGQALAYKIGQLKFLELRTKAQSELGENFILRDFHDEVLRHGALPMGILEKLVEEWIVQQKRKANSATRISKS